MKRYIIYKFNPKKKIWVAKYREFRATGKTYDEADKNIIAMINGNN